MVSLTGASLLEEKPNVNYLGTSPNFDWVDEFASTDQWLAEQVNFDLSNQAMDGMAVVLPAVDMSIDSIHTVSSWGETLIEGFSLHVDAGTRILIF
jgi:hypothetical protein